MILNLMKTKVTSFAVVILLDEPVLPQGLHKNIQMVGLGYNCNIFSFVYIFFGGRGQKSFGTVLGGTKFWGNLFDTLHPPLRIVRDHSPRSKGCL